MCFAILMHRLNECVFLYHFLGLILPVWQFRGCLFLGPSILHWCLRIAYQQDIGSDVDQIIKVAGSIAQINKKLISFYFTTKMLDNYTECKIKLTRDQSILWEKHRLGYVLCINILRQFLQILVLTVVDRFDLQGREFLGHHQKEGVRAKEMGTLIGPDLNSTTFEDRKIYQGKSTFSHFINRLSLLH